MHLFNAERVPRLGKGIVATMQPGEEYSIQNVEVERGVVAAATFLINVCHRQNYRWWCDPKTKVFDLISDDKVGCKLMLIVSEVAEAMEGHRKRLMDDKLPHRPMFEVELADALVRIFDLAGAMGIDLPGALHEKLIFNDKREDHTEAHRLSKHGKRY